MSPSFDVYVVQWKRTILIHFHKHYGVSCVRNAAQSNVWMENKQNNKLETKRNNKLEIGHRFVYFYSDWNYIFNYYQLQNSERCVSVWMRVRAFVSVWVCVCVCAYDCACRCVCVHFIQVEWNWFFFIIPLYKRFYLLNAVLQIPFIEKSLFRKKQTKSVSRCTFSIIFEWICEIAHFCVCLYMCMPAICNSAKRIV